MAAAEHSDAEVRRLEGCAGTPEGGDGFGSVGIDGDAWCFGGQASLKVTIEPHKPAVVFAQQLQGLAFRCQHGALSSFSDVEVDGIVESERPCLVVAGAKPCLLAHEVWNVAARGHIRTQVLDQRAQQAFLHGGPYQCLLYLGADDDQGTMFYE